MSNKSHRKMKNNKSSNNNKDNSKQKIFRLQINIAPLIEKRNNYKKISTGFRIRFDLSSVGMKNTISINNLWKVVKFKATFRILSVSQVIKSRDSITIGQSRKIFLDILHFSSSSQKIRSNRFKLESESSIKNFRIVFMSVIIS